MTYSVAILLLLGFVALLITSSKPRPVTLRREVYADILATVNARYEGGDLDREEYERILQVLR